MLNDKQREWVLKKEKEIREKFSIVAIGQEEEATKLVDEVEKIQTLAKDNPDVNEFFLETLKYYEAQYYRLMGVRR